jgi:hypothetical protein
MLDFELLAGACDPDPTCPKVVRVAQGQLAVVGEAAQASSGSITETVSISSDLYLAALRRLFAVVSELFSAGSVQVTGAPVAATDDLRSLGVGPGEGAVLISESAFRDLAVARAAI